MVLLTSSQAQVALSSAIIITFTFLLFLSGYILQQRTVESLHTAIRPHSPSPRHKPASDTSHSNPTTRLRRPLGKLKDRSKLQADLTAQDEFFDWSKLAYAQLVRDHSEVCNALILFAELYRLRSPAPRLLLFPKDWVRDNDGEVLNPFLETSRRLLRKASRRYRVVLVPVEPTMEGDDASDPSRYSVSSLFTLTHYDRVLTFPPPGLILNAGPLDSILAFSETSSVAAYPLLNTTSSLSSFLVIRPSTESSKVVGKVQSKHAKSTDLEILESAFPTPTLLLSDNDPDLFPARLYSTSATLRTQKGFNATDYLESTAYIHLSDPELPGPEYDVPYTSIVKMRPTDEDQGFLWEKMYSTFKDRRYGVCGLDLETWPPVVPIEKEKEGEKHEIQEQVDRAKIDL